MTDIGAIVEGLAERLGPAAAPPEPLEGGITNRNYRLRLGGDDYVLRLPGKDTELLGIRRDAERIANEAAAALGIAPAVAAADERYLLTRFVVCTPIDGDELRAGPEPVARALRAFHDSGIELPVRFWVPELLASYAQTVAERGGVLPPRYTLAEDLAGRIARALPLSDPVPCHNDLLAANLLRVQSSEGPPVMLVDWEYAGIGHRLFDLGNLAVNNEFDDGAHERLLAAYYDEPPTAARVAALQLMRLMSDAREAAWGVVQGAISELDFDFGDYAERHFDRLERAAADPRFERWLAAASAA
ncbi:MAG TPA: choline kinase family protein [Solirubrobacteraceae bacterium]|nr:choline kinase family protein [Solirubrobacteraceae bacterium]